MTLNRTWIYIIIPLGYKVTTKIGFASPTRVLGVGFNMIPYVKKATHMSSYYGMTSF